MDSRIDPILLPMAPAAVGATAPSSEDLRPAVGRPLDLVDGLGFPVHPRARCPPTINRPRTLRAWRRPGHLLWPVRRPSALRPPPGPVGGVQGCWCLRGGSLLYRPTWLRDREPAIDPAAPRRGGVRRGAPASALSSTRSHQVECAFGRKTHVVGPQIGGRGQIDAVARCTK